MSNYRFARFERINRVRAFFLTVLVQAALIGILLYGGDVDVVEWVSQTWDGFFGPTEEAVAVRP